MSISLMGSAGLSEIQLGLYPDNTPVINYAEAWDKNYGNFYAMVLQPSTMQEFFTGMMICESIRERGGSIDTLVIPTIPGARQDRLKWEGDMLFTLKYVAKAINDQGFNKVVTLDPHSMATVALIDRLVVPPINLYLPKQPFLQYDSVVAPDLGAAKRAQEFAQWAGIETVLYGHKHRDHETNKLTGFSILNEDQMYSNTRALIVDDLCDAGGTFIGLNEVLVENDVTADLFVTHGLFTKGTEKLAGAFQKIYATDSWPIRHERVNYINVVEGLI